MATPKPFAFTPAVLLAGCILLSAFASSRAAAECSNDGEDDTLSAMQSTKELRRHVQASGKSNAAIAVVATPGSRTPCCGKDPKECGLLGANFTLSMAKSIVEGIEETAPEATVKLIDLTVECPTPSELAEYDAIIAGAPVWNGIPSPDMISYLDEWNLFDNKLRCKIGAAFTTGGGHYTGVQTTLETFHRVFQTFQMIIVPGPTWQTGQGAAAPGTDEMVYGGPADDKFLAHARGLGARIANFTSIMKEMPKFCGEY